LRIPRGFSRRRSIGAGFRRGTAGALDGAMEPANDFIELLVWQLGDELRIEVLKFTERPPLAQDWKFRRQVADAVDSVCRNIAEGFAADTHGGFAWYLRVSRRSLNELRDALQSMLLKQYATTIELAPAFTLIRRLRPALDNFIEYLERTPHYRQRRRPNGPTPTPRRRSER
jgi:four helix bundle protein